MRRISLLLLAISLVLSASAQKKRFESRVLAGFTASQVQGDGYGGFDKAGLNLGFGVSRSINRQSSWGFDLLYTQKGSRKVPDPENGDFTLYRLQLDYMSVPISYRYEYKKFQAIIGPEIAVLVRYKEEDQFGEVIRPLRFKPYDLGIVMGLAFKAGKKLRLQVLLQESLLSVRETQPYAKGALGRFRGMYNTAITTSLVYQLSGK